MPYFRALPAELQYRIGQFFLRPHTSLSPSLSFSPRGEGSENGMSGIDEGDDKRDLDRVTKVFDMNFNDQQLMVQNPKIS